jgi:hypothetical protein
VGGASLSMEEGGNAKPAVVHKEPLAASVITGADVFPAAFLAARPSRTIASCFNSFVSKLEQLLLLKSLSKFPS